MTIEPLPHRHLLPGKSDHFKSADGPGCSEDPQEKISVIVPTLNEAPSILEVLERTRPGKNIEVIVVDGGSRDDTREKACSWGATVLESTPGRAHQMNFGAEHARGDILLFLHADCLLPAGFHREIRNLLYRHGVIAGAFRLGIQSRSLSYRLIEQGANFRSILLRMPYGDQGIFLKASTFRASGGFPLIPFMEDFGLMLRLRRQGKIVISRARIVTSARRWDRLGPWKTTLNNQLLILCFLIGISPARLRRWYQDERAVESDDCVDNGATEQATD